MKFIQPKIENRSLWDRLTVFREGDFTRIFIGVVILSIVQVLIKNYL